ncbi:MAG: DUF2796 domain-containing protein [Pseudomonadota bacterium]
MGKMGWQVLATVAFAATAPIASANDDHEHETEHAHEHAHDGPVSQVSPSARAHVHGAWDLFAALDEQTLTITFVGPLTDLVGVEHPIGSAEEAAEIDALRVQLRVIDPLARLSSKAKCALAGPASVNAVQGVDLDDRHAHHEDHDHGGVHEDPHHEHSHDEHGADIEITYSFLCSAPKQLVAIDVSAFDMFDGIQKIDAVFLSESKQAAARLTAETAKLIIQ